MVPATFEGFVAIIKNLQYNFPKTRGGVKGHLELFRKNICFGIYIRPLVVMVMTILMMVLIICQGGPFIVTSTLDARDHS